MTSSRRSQRASITKLTSYNEIDSDDENEQFKSIVGYESGSDFENDLKERGSEYEGDESDEENNDDGFDFDDIERPKKKRKKREKVDGVFVPWDPSQRTMATAGRTKVNKNIEKGHFGPVPGVEVGQRWQYRIQLSELGVHAPPVAGISGGKDKGCNSLVLAGGYEDDKDHGYEFTYTGSGGRDLSGNKRTAEQSFDQTLTKSNAAIAVSCNAKFNDKKGNESTDWQEGKPIRVCRSYKFQKHSKYAPDAGVRYDGIYKVVKYYPQTGESGFIVWKFVLRRDDPSPAPWEKSAKKYECEMYVQNISNEPEKVEGQENDVNKETSDNKENKNSNSLEIKEENTQESNESVKKTTKGRSRSKSKTNDISENNSDLEISFKSQKDNEKKAAKPKKSKAKSKKDVDNSENTEEDNPKSEQEYEKNKAKTKKSKAISKIEEVDNSENTEEDNPNSKKQDERNKAKPKKSRAKSKTKEVDNSENTEEDKPKSEEKDEKNKAKPKQSKAKSKKEVNNSKKDETEDEKTKVQPKILNFFKSKTSLEVKIEPSSDEIIEKENNENVANEIDKNRSRRSSNMSPTKKSPAKTTKNCSKRKRDVLNKTTDNDKVKEDITAMDENEQKTRRSKRAKVDIS